VTDWFPEMRSLLRADAQCVAVLLFSACQFNIYISLFQLYLLLAAFSVRKGPLLMPSAAHVVEKNAIRISISKANLCIIRT
jgi:hypothetical protein